MCWFVGAFVVWLLGFSPLVSLLFCLFVGSSVSLLVGLLIRLDGSLFVCVLACLCMCVC